MEHLSIPLVCEVTVASIKLSGKEQLYMIGVYRPPNNLIDITAEAIEVLHKVLDNIPTHSRIILIGDINIDILRPTRETIMFDEFLLSHNMTRLQLSATRVFQGHQSSIDAICTNAEIDESQVKILHTGISDHFGQLCYLPLSVESKKTTTSSHRHVSPENLTNLKRYLAEESWTNVLQQDSVEEAYRQYLKTVTYFLDLTCPIKKFRVVAKPKARPCYDEEALRLKKDFLKANERYCLSGSQEDKQTSTQLKKAYDLKLRTLRREASAAHIDNAANKNKAVWEIINSERNHQHKDTISGFDFIVKNGDKIDDPIDIANHFNNYFSTIADETLKQNLCINPTMQFVQNPPVGMPLTSMEPTSIEEISKVIDSLKTKSSFGLNEISSKILKFCKNEVAVPIFHITQLSLLHGTFPSSMKISKVIPLHKKSSKHHIENFRPISLIPTESKIIEKIVLSRLFKHLQLNNLLTEEQHGFIKGRSTMTAIVDLFEHIVDNIEAGNNVVGVQLDLSKAFDCLSHDLIIRKLFHLGIQGTALSWFSAYLEGRRQVVEVTQTIKRITTISRSEVLSMDRGVPQGSVLGPVLFILFTNDFPNVLHSYSNLVMYADDSMLLTANSSVENLEINSYIAVNIAMDYCRNNDLVFNESKTKQISFGNKKDDISDLPNLQSVSSTNYLGIIVDDKLSWLNHINNLCLKLSSAIYAIKRTKAISTTKATITAYHALFESHMRYGLAVWGGSTERNLQRILILQKKALRIMAGLGCRESCRGVFKEWRLSTVVSLYIVECIVIATTHNVQQHQDIHSYNTRHANNFTLPIHKLTLSETKPTYAGAKFFNNLPDELKKMEGRKLKKSLHSWFQERPFYSVKEFLNWRADSQRM
uniref:Reverse transcriptase domain-containing protein n=1 Tax=Homalodisca liturata TaxID=320908 RepID=A0A1B6IB92_9HEMI